jgi:outer membrane protein assembly factor BamE (lipoprotein component of BamABCDE complex)
MVSIKGQKSCSKILILLMVLWIILAGGCTIGRTYIGSEIKQDPKEKIQNGVTTKSEILEYFGPPDLVQRQFDGDVFIYAFLRKNSTKFFIEEPLITKVTIFSYSRIQQKKDALVILFDKDGVVKNYGYQRATSELTTF